MGRVYLGADAGGRPVAIKVLHPDSTAETVERFLREARLLASIHHPNIIPVHDVGHAEGLHYYVMDYVDGPTLQARLMSGPLDPDEARQVGRDLLEGLGAVHAIGVVHRDVKPSNVFLLPGRAILGDFGVAHIADATPLTSAGAAVGTAGYQAPEQLQGSGVTARADLYAVGITLYESLTGRRWRILERPSQADWHGISRPLALTLGKALAFNPDDRWESAQVFRSALDGRWALRRRLVRWSGASAAAVLGLAAALWPSSSSRRTEPADLALVPFEGQGPSAELSRFVLKRLEWYPQWSVVAQGADSAIAEGNVRPARAYVSGRLIPSSAGFTLELAIRDSAKALLTSVAAPGDTADLDGWSARIADSIVAKRFPRWLDQFREFAARQGGNVPAYREYLRGEDAFARDAWEEAERHYRNAFDLDSTFLQAAWRLTVVRRWARVPFEADLRHLYDHHRADLPPLYRLLAEAQLTPDIRSRIALYERAAREFPRNGYAGLLYADELFHRGPLVGIPLDSSLRLLDRGRAPGFDRPLALDLSTWGYIRLGLKDQAWQALRERGTTASPEVEPHKDVDVEGFLRLAYVERFHPAIAPAVRWWALERNNSVSTTDLASVFRVSAIFDLPEAQLALARIVAERDSSAAARATACEATALALMMLGRSSEAMPQFDSAAAFLGSARAHLQALEWRVLPSAVGWPRGDTLGERLALAGLERIAEDTTLGGEAAWTLALAAYARGDTTSAGRWTSRVERDTTMSESARRHGSLLRAHAEAARGRWREALEISELAVAYDSTGRLGGPFQRAAAHLARGTWWQALEEPDRAEAEWLWYENSDFVGWPHGDAQAGEVDAVFSVAARRLRATLARARGDRRAACAGMRRVRDLWRGADPSFAAWRLGADSVVRSCTT